MRSVMSQTLRSAQNGAALRSSGLSISWIEDHSTRSSMVTDASVVLSYGYQ